MLRVTVRGLWLDRRRLALTTASVALGVAFLAGTLVLRDTMRVALHEQVGRANAGVDAEVRGSPLFDTGTGPVRGRLDGALIATVGAAEGVAAAEGAVVVSGGATLLDATGGPVGGQGGGSRLDSWVADDRLNPHALTAGRGPQADEEIAISDRAADRAGYELGDRVGLVTPGGQADYVLVGTYRDTGEGPLEASLTLPEAQRLSGAGHDVDIVLVRADHGVTQSEVVGRIAPELPRTAEVVTGAEAGRQQADAALRELGFVPDLLMIFAAVALGVGSFIIHNTFSILVAQRTRGLALLRAIGATRAQVHTSVLGEAAVVGTVSAGLGLALGVALAIGLHALLGVVGLELPGRGAVVGAGTVVPALVAGTTVTGLSALLPAWRATRVPALAALRRVAHETARISRVRVAIGVTLLVAATAASSPAFSAEPDASALPLVGLGALLAFVAVVLSGPLLTVATARALRRPLARLAGVTGVLAGENAARSPERTAAAAAALMVGVGLVSAVTVFATSMEASIGGEVGRGFRGDLVVRAEAGGGIPTELAERLAMIDGVRTVAALRRAPVQVTLPNGMSSTERVAAADPAALAEVVDAQMVSGTLPALSADGAVIDRSVADDAALGIGDRISLRFATGEEAELVIEAIGDDILFAGNWLVTHEAFSATNPNQLDYQLPLRIADDADLATTRATIEEAVASYPTLDVLDADEFVAANTSQVDQILNLLYVLLALSAAISLIGVANTLSLSIHERTREIGLLRAVGTTRAQLRSVIRWESVIITLTGTIPGIALGVTLSYVLVQVLADQGLSQFALPVAPLLAIAALFAGLGVAASAPPVRRAVRLDVLTAIQTE
jgi:putative ABC transport system permease protein